LEKSKKGTGAKWNAKKKNSQGSGGKGKGRVQRKNP